MKIFQNYIILFYYSISINTKNCPDEIKKYYSGIKGLKSGSRFRYSSCFYCIGYTKTIYIYVKFIFYTVQIL